MSKKGKNMYDVVIIGAGPAGLSASIYAKRAGLSAVTVEQSTMSGGQILTTYEVDNYPGFPGINWIIFSYAWQLNPATIHCDYLTGQISR